MTFLDNEDEDATPRAGKYKVLALVMIFVAGGVVWFSSRTEREPDGQSADSPPSVVETQRPKSSIPSMGTLVVTANVPEAWVVVGSKRVGQAPFRSDAFEVGLFRVRVESEGYAPFAGNVRVRPGEIAELAATLERALPSLRVSSDVLGASVFLDRRYIGATPVNIEKVTPGQHQLTLSAEGFDVHAETLTITDEHREIRVRFKDAKLNERVAVIHKHRMGSCEGHVIADNDGMSYKTDNQKCAFRLSYAGIQRFEVDYIAKNLHLKSQKGRKYNFTEPNGDADALFVFHKNVSAYMDKK